MKPMKLNSNNMSPSLKDVYGIFGQPKPIQDLERASALMMKRNKSVDDLRGIYNVINGKPEDHFLRPADWQALQRADEEHQREEDYWAARENVVLDDDSEITP